MTGSAAHAPVIGFLPPGFEAWEELLSLIMRAFAPMDGVIDPPSSAHRLTPDGLAEKAGRETVLVAESEAGIVGCLFAVTKSDHLYLNKLAVEPAWQGKGIGRRLVEAAEALARRDGHPALQLKTRVEMTGNHEAFRRLGFVEVDRTAHPGFSRPTTIIFGKTLT